MLPSVLHVPASLLFVAALVPRLRKLTSCVSPPAMRRRLRYVKNSGITSMPIASITVGFLPLVSSSVISGGQTGSQAGFLYNCLCVVFKRGASNSVQELDGADESFDSYNLPPSVLQNHVLGRLSINQSLMSGGSVWFIRKRCSSL